ncbi:hypothetical protein CEP54_013332 [Fusarium duplospermum]|uniref:DUF7730 domain-containing protein n=1 Tax=Fusarium duplospermum TaxID=1325734 RepID=A0A428P3F5_9HYPO|nr:hypothetical protein CEP54_013332 [Fusarium duplospermum]
MLMNFETRERIEKPGPINQQEDSPFFQKIIPDVRRLIYLEAFGSRSVHVVPGLRRNEPAYLLYACRQPDDASPHDECPDVGEEKCRLATNLLYTCQMAYNEGATLLFKSNKLLFSDQDDCSMFFNQVPDSFPNSVRSLDICVQFNCYDIDLIQPMCAMLSHWTGDFVLRMRWDMDHHRRKKRFANFNTALAAIQRLMKNPRIRPKFWAPKMLEDGVGLVLEKEDCQRLEFVKDETESDPDDEDEDEDDWDDDSDDYYDDDDSEGYMTDMIYDDEETLRYWQSLADQA